MKEQLQKTKEIHDQATEENIKMNQENLLKLQKDLSELDVNLEEIEKRFEVYRAQESELKPVHDYIKTMVQQQGTQVTELNKILSVLEDVTMYISAMTVFGAGFNNIYQ